MPCDPPQDMRVDVVQTGPPSTNNTMTVRCECGYEILIRHHRMATSRCNNCGRVYYYRIESVVYLAHAPMELFE